MDEDNENVGGANPLDAIPRVEPEGLVEAAMDGEIEVPAVQLLDADNNESNDQAIIIIDDSQNAANSHLRESNQNVPENEVTPSRKKRRRSSPTKKVTPKKVPDEDEDDGSTCSICFDTWELSGEHRLVALRCGHLFGESCIKRWIKESAPNMKTCPTCKSRAHPRDFRQLYAKRIVVVDKSEEYRLQNLYESEKKKSFELATSVGSLQVELALSRVQIERLENQLEYAKLNGMVSAGTSSAMTPNSNTYKLSMEKTMMINREPGCRSMVYGRRSQYLFVSQKSSQSLFPGYGVRFFNVDGFILSNSFMHMSVKQIRDLSLDNDEEMIVSASMDLTVKMYSVPNKCPVSVFTPTDKPIWSCAFDCVRPKYLYLGSQNGSTYTYDIRSPHNYVQEHKTIGDMSPVVSICPVPCNEIFPLGGFIVCKLQSMWFYEYNAAQNVIANKLIVDGPFIAVSYDERTRQLLISTRPSSKYATTRYIIAELTRVDQTVVLHRTITMNGSKTQKVMTRCAQMKIMDDTVVAAYLEDSKKLTTWNTQKSTVRMQSLPVDNTIYDMCPFYVNQKVFLGALSESHLRLFQANTQ